MRPARHPWSLAALLALPCAMGLALPAAAQTPSVDELLKRIDALQRRVEELESRKRPPAPAAQQARTAKPPPAAPHGTALATAAAPTAPSPAPAAPAPAPAPAAAATPAGFLPNAPIPGLRAPEPMGTQFEDALRSDLPGIALRVPGTDTQVRVYGFAKLTGYADMNGRNQTDAPAPSAIPLAGSAAAQQGGDFGMTARFSRLGLDTRTLTGWGTLETRLEADFGGGTSIPSSTATFRLRQAWAELGTDRLRVLAGQANSLWNEGLFETLIDATNLNQSFTRQAQLRVTGRLSPSWTGAVSIEAPETQYTAVNGVITPSSRPDGGASPAFNSVPDLLARLTYQSNGVEWGTRLLLRELSVKTDGTASIPAGPSRNATGWGAATHVRLPMRLLSPGFGADELLGMAYFGDGIGRYFAGNTGGQGALTNLGLPGVTTQFALDAVQSYGGIVAYRRFWLPQLRSNVSYAYARQDYPDYARAFTPGSVAATSLNREMQQVFVNLIWSPFATERNGVVGNGWLDVGAEYVFTRRDLFNGSAASGGGSGHGIANRVMGAVVGRF